MKHSQKPIITKTISKLRLPTWSLTDVEPSVVFVKEQIKDDILYANMEITVHYDNFSVFEMKILNDLNSSAPFKVGEHQASLKITAGKVNDKFGQMSQTFELEAMIVHDFKSSMDDQYKKTAIEDTRFTLKNSSELKSEICSMFRDGLKNVIIYFQHEYRTLLRSNQNLDNALMLATKKRIQLSSQELDSKNLLESKVEGLVNQIADVVEEIRSFNSKAINQTVDLNRDEIPSHFQELVESQLKLTQQKQRVDRNSLLEAVTALV